MRREVVCSVLSGMMAGVVVVSPARALTDGKVEEIVKAVHSYASEPGQEFSQNGYEALLEELLLPLNLDDASIDQLEQLGVFFVYTPVLQKRLRDKLSVLVDNGDEGVIAGRAAILRFMTSMGGMNSAEVTREFAAVLEHPGVGEAIAEGCFSDLFGILRFLAPSVLDDNAAGIASLFISLSKDLPFAKLSEAIECSGVLLEMKQSVPDEQFRIAHENLLSICREAVARARKEGAVDAEGYFKSKVVFLNGSYGRGELLNHPAPSLTFDWVSNGVKPARLSEYKGRVVVLDFWATWCGPCLASFPNLRALRKKYDDEVVIVGVTSLQGRHFPMGEPPIDTSGDPQREFELMRGFVEKMEMTWTVAFTEEDVFNSDFGVMGIPHLAIIDDQGIVRYNGLSPLGPLGDKTEAIDALLEVARERRAGGK